MKNIRTKGNTYSRHKEKEEDIPVFPVEVRFIEPTATPMPKIKKHRTIKPKNKAGKKSKSGFHWSEKHNKWIDLREVL